MRRRALLATVGAVGLSGCLGGSDDDTTPQGTPAEEPPTEFDGISPVTTTETESVGVGPFGEIRVEQPTELPFAFDVSLSPGETVPELRVDVTNEGDRTFVARPLNGTGFPFTGDVSGEREGETLVAGTVSSEEPTETDLECAVGRLAETDTRKQTRLDPDDTAIEIGHVANHVDNTVCWPEGEHRFTEGYEVWSTEQAFRFEFAFSLVS